MISETAQVYLEKVKIPLRLAVADAAGWPIVISLWFLFRDGYLYCATQQKARVVSYLLKNPECGYEIASDLPPYCGVRGRARAEIDPQMGAEILNLLLYKYLGGTNNSLAQKLLKKADSEVAIRLKVHSASTWNFSNRMQEFSENRNLKICP